MSGRPQEPKSTASQAAWDKYNERLRAWHRNKRKGASQSGTMNSTAFRDVPQRIDPSVMNTYFNAGPADGDTHGHVKHSNNPDGTTDYLYARDVEGTEYDV